MFAFMLFSSCELNEIENPNAPTVNSFADGASAGDIQLLATGLEAIMRNDLAFHYDTESILGREYYDLSGVDPRYTGEIIKGPLDNNGFLTTRSYAAWYKVVKSANILIEAVENSVAGFSDEDKNNYYGYAKTLKAYALLMVANRQFDNGIRLDVADPDNLGPNVGYEEALAGIMIILEEADNHLSSASSEFVNLSSGFDGFDTAETFSEFNRAVAARVALYQGNSQLALSLLTDSFFDIQGDLYEGPAHVFGLTGNDILNTQFHVPLQSGQEFMVHDSWISDAEAGDTRVTEKSVLLPGGTAFDGLSAEYQLAVYDSNTDPVYLIRNEELILIYAEANIGIDNSETIKAINRVRNAASLPDYSGTPDTSNSLLLAEVLKQRRYSLLAEGHRWIDLRRLNMLNEANIPLDRAGDNIIDAFPTPFTEQL